MDFPRELDLRLPSRAPPLSPSSGRSVPILRVRPTRVMVAFRQEMSGVQIRAPGKSCEDKKLNSVFTLNEPAEFLPENLGMRWSKGYDAPAVVMPDECSCWFFVRLWPTLQGINRVTRFSFRGPLYVIFDTIPVGLFLNLLQNPGIHFKFRRHRRV